MYAKEMTDPMKLELTSVGVEDLATPDSVVDFLTKKVPSSVVLVNSVCGCAAGTARPALIKSLAHAHRPKQVGSVFAGVDFDAVEKAREFFIGYRPSSPSIAFFRDDELVYLLERHNIEGVDAQTLSQIIGSVYDKFFQAEIQDDIEISDPASLIEVSVKDTKKLLDSQAITLLDCRDEAERSLAKIELSELLTQELAEKMIAEWEKDRPIVIYCHRGNRSKQAVNFFKQYQFNNIKSMKGGIQAWTDEIDSTIPTY